MVSSFIHQPGHRVKFRKRKQCMVLLKWRVASISIHRKDSGLSVVVEIGSRNYGNI